MKKKNNHNNNNIVCCIREHYKSWLCSKFKNSKRLEIELDINMILTIIDYILYIHPKLLVYIDIYDIYYRLQKTLDILLLLLDNWVKPIQYVYYNKEMLFIYIVAISSFICKNIISDYDDDDDFSISVQYDLIKNRIFVKNNNIKIYLHKIEHDIIDLIINNKLHISFKDDTFSEILKLFSDISKKESLFNKEAMLFFVYLLTLELYPLNGYKSKNTWLELTLYFYKFYITESIPNYKNKERDYYSKNENNINAIMGIEYYSINYHSKYIKYRNHIYNILSCENIQYSEIINVILY